MSLLAEVVQRLEVAGVDHCLVGGAALALHGVPRSTQDDDLLVVDGQVLETAFWGPLGQSVIRAVRGDHDDPLAGVVRLERAGERSVDVVVGRWKWQRDTIARAQAGTLLDLSLKVADAADLVLLKLDAGGPQDRNDALALLSLHGPSLAAAVEARLPDAPATLTDAWTRLRSERASAG